MAQNHGRGVVNVGNNMGKFDFEDEDEEEFEDDSTSDDLVPLDEDKGGE